MSAEVRILFLLLTWLCPLLPAAEPGDACDPGRRMAWAHEVPWMHQSDTARLAERYHDLPAIPGRGDRLADQKAEIEVAMQAGIDGFFVDVVGGPRPRSTSWIHGISSRLAAAEGTPFLVGACLDGSHPDLQWQVEELDRMIVRFAGHANYPRVRGRPVFATYHADGRTPAQWQAVRDGLRSKGREIYLIGDLSRGFQIASQAEIADYARVFDMLYLFSTYPHRPGLGQRAYGTTEKFIQHGAASQAAGIPWMSSLWPGYLGGWLSGRNDYHQPFRGVDVLWEGAMALRPERDAWVHLTTWNDHDETTLMPTVFGGEGRLALCSAAIAAWRDPSAMPQPRLLVAYRREEQIGTDLRIEVASTPGPVGSGFTVEGVLRDPAGQVLHRLPELRLRSGGEGDRREWIIPTAGLGSVCAWVPELTVQDQEGRTVARTLPAIMPVAGWLQNPVTMVMPFDRLPEGQAGLQLEVRGDRLEGSVTIRSPVAVRRATLWRNDRQVGTFTGKPEAPRLHCRIASQQAMPISIRLEGGRLVAVQRRGGGVTWNGSADRLDQQVDAAGITLTLAVETPDAVIILGSKDGTPFRQPVGTLSSGGYDPLVGDGVTVVRLDHDPGPWPAGSPGDTAFISLLGCRAGPRDRFAARVDLVDGTGFWSPVVVVGDRGNAVMPVLVQGRSLDSSVRDSGTMGHSGFLDHPTWDRPARVVEAPVAVAAGREARWLLDGNGKPDIGDRWLSIPPSIQGSMGMHLDGRTAIPLPGRLLPHGAGTIDLEVMPDGHPTVMQDVLVRRGWATGLSLRIGVDSRPIVTRDGAGHEPVVVESRLAVVPGRWNRLRVVDDERSVRLWVDGVLAGQASHPPGRAHGNATAVLGGQEAGFTGWVRNLHLQGWPEDPPDTR